MSLECMSVNLDDFLRFLIRKWRIILICIVLGGGTAVMFAKFTGNVIVVPKSENYDELKAQEKGYKDFIEHSVTMQLDPLNVFERTIYIDNVSDRHALKDYVESEKIWRNIKKTLENDYLSEIIFWKDVENIGSVELIVQHRSEELCGELSEYIIQQIQLVDERAEITIGEQRRVIDKSTADLQTWYRNRLQDIQGQLEHTSPGCIIEVSSSVALFFGALTGGLCALFSLFLVFISKKEV